VQSEGLIQACTAKELGSGLEPMTSCSAGPACVVHISVKQEGSSGTPCLGSFGCTGLVDFKLII